MIPKVTVAFLAAVLAVSSAGLVGAPVEAEMDDEGVQGALQFAMAQYNRKTNDAYVRTVSDVIGVQKQVVAGLKYIFTVNVARTNCRKGGVETVCAVHQDPAVANMTKCKITVWSRPWMNSIKVLSNTCL